MRHFSVLMAFLFGIGLLTGCGARWVRTPLVDQKMITVNLEHKVLKKQVVKQQYDHPFDIDRQGLKVLLTQLEYLDEPRVYGTPEQKPVFQQEEIERLVPALADALATANADQRVRFISHNKGGGLLFKKKRVTEGVSYVESGRKLNLAFADVNYEILTNPMENISERGENQDPLRIKMSSTPIVGPDYAKHHLMKNDISYPMWVVVDLENIPATTVPESATEKADPATPAESKVAPTTEKTVSPTAVSDETSAAEKQDDAWEIRRQESREKLQYFKELYESGLIDENEYKAQKEKLLNQL